MMGNDFPVNLARESDDPAVLDRLADSDDMHVLGEVAMNGSTAPETLGRLYRRLAESLDDDGRADSKDISIEERLRRMNLWTIPRVFCMLFMNPRLPLDILEDLVDNGAMDVLTLVSRNTGLTSGMFARLAEMKYGMVILNLAFNRSCPAEVLGKIAAEWEDKEVLNAVMGNPNAPAKLKEKVLGKLERVGSVKYQLRKMLLV